MTSEYYFLFRSKSEPKRLDLLTRVQALACLILKYKLGPKYYIPHAVVVRNHVGTGDIRSRSSYFVAPARLIYLIERIRPPPLTCQRTSSLSPAPRSPTLSPFPDKIGRQV